MNNVKEGHNGLLKPLRVCVGFIEFSSPRNIIIIMTASILEAASLLDFHLRESVWNFCNISPLKSSVNCYYKHVINLTSSAS
jgi:hypothetical protein